MMWLDCGIGACACGAERRIYRPEGTIERAMCLPCAQVWEFKRNPVDPKRLSSRKEHPVTAVVRQRRARFNAQGLCIDCGKEPQIPGIKRGVNCRSASRKASRCAS